MEEEVKISFWKKLKTSVFGLEDYQKLAVQKVRKTVGYLAKIMLIFAFIISIAITYRFGVVVNQVRQYIESEITQIQFENNTLSVLPKEGEMIEIEDDKFLNGKFIINTQELSEEQISTYTEQIKGYQTGILVLKDKVIVKAPMLAVPTTLSLADIANQYHVVKLDKQDVVAMISGTQVYILYAMFFISMFLYLFIIYFSVVLLDAILYSLLAYLTGVISRLRLKYSACYNIAVHALTLPIFLNLVYMIINLFTGYTIQYFDIMYMAITCIYIITAVLMIKSDMIKKQMELSKIIAEQEKVRQEMERREQEKKEEQEKERLRKEDEKKRQEEKKKQKENNGNSEQKETKKKREPKENEGPQPEANIKPSNS